MAIPVHRVEKMLGNVYNIYRHSVTSEVIVRTLNYSLPSLLHNHIDVVTPTTYFSTMKSMRTTSFLQPEIPALENGQDVIEANSASVPSSCSSTITPACLIALYNTTGYVPTATASNTLGIAGYLEQYANHNDLQVLFICHIERLSSDNFDVFRPSFDNSAPMPLVPILRCKQSMVD
jgi:tripeptidyl-peptidase-1